MLDVSLNHQQYKRYKGGKQILGMFTLILNYDGIWMKTSGITNVPSLSLWDENAPLDTLFTSIDVHSWEIHSGIDLRIVNAVDKVAPLGDFINGVAYIHGQDVVYIEIPAFHMGYDLPAENLPFSTTYSIDLIGNNASTQSTNSLNSDGTSINRIVLIQPCMVRK